MKRRIEKIANVEHYGAIKREFLEFRLVFDICTIHCVLLAIYRSKKVAHGEESLVETWIEGKTKRSAFICNKKWSINPFTSNTKFTGIFIETFQLSLLNVGIYVVLGFILCFISRISDTGTNYSASDWILMMKFNRIWNNKLILTIQYIYHPSLLLSLNILFWEIFIFQKNIRTNQTTIRRYLIIFKTWYFFHISANLKRI